MIMAQNRPQVREKPMNDIACEINQKMALND